MTDVDVPVVGRVPKPAVYAGLAAVVGYAGWAWWRARQQGDGSVLYTEDPATGTASPGGGEYVNPAPRTTPDPDPAKLAPTTDQEWVARALEKMTWFEPGYLTTTLGKYLARTPLTSEEASVVRSAWGLLGKPPGGQQITLTTAGGTPGNPPKSLPAPVLSAALMQGDWAVLTWSPVNGATKYVVHARGGGNQTPTTGWSVGSVTTYRYWVGKGTGLVKFTVQAVGADGTLSPESNALARTF